ncbi:sigma 54-interacting transcriptional regulator, partial [Thermodesulfobacteriota bacterium]
FTDVDDMVHIAATKLSGKTELSISDFSKAKMILFVVVGITPFVAAFFGYIFMRGLTQSVKVLLTATRKIKGGNLDYRIMGLKDEFGEVAASFNEMASRMEKYTHRLEGQTLKLEHAHHEMSTFCEVLKKIGIQQNLDGVGSFLMKELETILKSPHMVLYVFSSDRNTLFALSAKGTAVYSNPELIQTTASILNEMDGIVISPRKPIRPPLLPINFPADGRQTIIPLGIQGYMDGAFLVVCTPECLCEKNKLDLVALILEQASGTIKRAALQEEKIRALEGRIDHTSEFSGIVGKDPKMQSIYKLIEDIAPSDSTILIQGESGTGKELVASAIYNNSLRKNNPFVIINCSAYPTTLLESELFGHEKGAFTGAIRQKIGRFEQADGGTVLLDEIGEIPLSAQIKLLRVLQTQKFERIGGEKTLSVDVRILAATNKDLLQEVKMGNFREDLYYRLNVIPIHIPPLRERRNDIPLQATHFMRRFATEQGKDIREFTSEAMKLLIDCSWPGNVRELENCVEHAVVLAKRKRIDVTDLPATLRQPSAALATRGTIGQNEARLLEEALEDCNWNKRKTAQRLGISRNTLYRKLRKYQINLPTIH